MSNIIPQPLLFDNSDIRRSVKDGVVYYSVVDVIAAIRKEGNPSTYWYKLKKKRFKDACPIWESMNVKKSNGQFQLSDCSTREQIFEIITYVPSPKVVNFRKWLAAIAEREFKELEKSPEQKWIETREKGKRIRNNLTRSMIEHNVDTKKIGAVTNILYQGGFDHDASSLREYKGLKPKTNVRDHMNSLELQITSVMETVLDELMDINQSNGYEEVKEDAIDSGEFGGRMRRDIERVLGKPVVTKENKLSTKNGLTLINNAELIIPE